MQYHFSRTKWYKTIKNISTTVEVMGKISGRFYSETVRVCTVQSHNMLTEKHEAQGHASHNVGLKHHEST